MNDQIILVGGGGHCHSCIDVIESLGHYRIQGILDMPERIGDEMLGYKFIGCAAQTSQFVATNVHFLVTAGQIKSSELRKRLYENLRSLGASCPTIISPRAHVSSHARVGAGSIVMHDALVNASAWVGENCIINTKALIEHDSTVGDHCHISTGAILNGNTHIGSDSFVGSGSVCVQGLKVPAYSFIKAGQLKVDS
jgi:sugar O-acyltransferase (sialic acid O-acetyltransferase NeuD family)